MYGALVAAPDSIRTGLLRFRAPHLPTEHRDGAAVDPVADRDPVDHPSQLRAGHQRLHHRRLRARVPRGRQLQAWAGTSTTSTSTTSTRTTCIRPAARCCMAPFGYLPVDASRYWFITFNTHRHHHRGLLAAAAVQVHARPRSPRPRCCWRCSAPKASPTHWSSPTSTAASCCCEVLFFRWLLDGKVNHQWWAGVAIGLTLVVKPLAGAAAVAAAAEPAVAGAGHRRSWCRWCSTPRRGRWSATR